MMVSVVRFSVSSSVCYGDSIRKFLSNMVSGSSDVMNSFVCDVGEIVLLVVSMLSMFVWMYMLVSGLNLLDIGVVKWLYSFDVVMLMMMILLCSVLGFMCFLSMLLNDSVGYVGVLWLNGIR